MGLDLTFKSIIKCNSSSRYHFNRHWKQIVQKIEIFLTGQLNHLERGVQRTGDRSRIQSLPGKSLYSHEGRGGGFKSMQGELELIRELRIC